MKLVGYWCPGSSEMYPTQIDPNLLTHLVYCFVGLDHHGELNFGKRDESEATELLEQAILLKKRNPNLKVIAAVGGWSEELVQVWSDLASRPVARAHFADNILNFILAYNLDGIDIDWEFPNLNRDHHKDKANFISLLQDIKRKLGTKYSLSIAIGAGEARAGLSYDVKEMFALCDFVNVMTYDLHGGWEHKTGLHSALYHGSHDNTIINVHNSIQFLRNNGVDKKKIVVGIPTYGCRFKLQDPNNHEIGAPASSHPVRKSSYRDIWPRVQCRDLTHQFDHEQKSSYAFHGNEWISFDCHNSVTEKANYIHHNGLGGAMFWTIDMDDYDGTTGQGRFPLISTVARILK